MERDVPVLLNCCRCDTPLSLRDRFLSTLSYDEFRCKPRQFSVSFRSALATALVLLFTFIFCSALALFLYKCRHRVSMREAEMDNIRSLEIIVVENVRFIPFQSQTIADLAQFSQFALLCIRCCNIL